MPSLNRSVVIGSLILFLSMSGCGGGGGGGGSDNNSRPRVTINAPGDDSYFSLADTIQFSGTATDSEDGALSGASVAWVSSQDGQIGTGTTVNAGDLSSGTHIIALTAVDSDGATDTDYITIHLNPIPDTGQTDNYTPTFGEDSDYAINAQSYTKLDDAGNDLPAGAPAWAMVRDNRTDLVWEVKTDDASIHDKDDTYDWQDAQDVFIALLNAASFGGHNDWRLPEVKELAMIVNADSENPAIDTAYFPYTEFIAPNRYWSATTFVDIPTQAWLAVFSDGHTGRELKTELGRVRAVRGGR